MNHNVQSFEDLMYYLWNNSKANNFNYYNALKTAITQSH